MYGYIVANQDELRGREMKEYRRFYCGLCHALRGRCGLIGQCSVNYDSTFLAILLTGLYDQENATHSKRCVVHPLKPQEYLTNDAIRYAADMNVVLTYLKCRDDWKDEKKSLRYLYGKLLGARSRKMALEQGEKIKAVFETMKHFTEVERVAQKNAWRMTENGEGASGERKTDARKTAFYSPAETLDALAAGFGNVLAEVFAWRNDEWELTLREVGYHLGKFIYLLDAWDDIEKDRKSGNYNPLLAMEQKFDCGGEGQSGGDSRKGTAMRTWVGKLLELTAADCAAAFEQLPIVEYVEILRNILYSGMWTAFYKKEEQR